MLCAAGAAGFGNLGFAPWAVAQPTSVHKTARSASDAEPAFQTLAEFVNRSPGERGEIDVLKGIAKFVTESGKDKIDSRQPTQRALGKVFEPEPFDLDVAWQPPLDLLTVPVGDFGVPLELVPVGSSGRFFPGGGFTPGSIPGGVAIPPTGSTPPDGGDPGSGGSVPPPAGAVPEPSTWVLILLGFFSAGYGLRKRKAAGAIDDELIAL